jgi:thiamine pyrophosphate-dependent acetolactate synthase large subunit-like protein
VNRRDVIEAFARRRGDAPVIVGPGVSGRMLFECGHRPATIYNMDMGYAVPMCMGLALALPGERVYALEGDGSLLTSLGALTTIARYHPPNLVVIVLDNGVYLTTGAIPTASGTGADLAGIGRASGMAHAVAVRDLAAFEQELDRATREDGPFLIVAQVEAQDRAGPAGYHAYPFDIVESAICFRRDLVDRGLVPPIWAV